MKTRTRRAGIAGLALMTVATWALLPADGQQAPAETGTARYELLNYDRGEVQVLDRVSGTIYAIKSKQSAFMLNPVKGHSVIRPVKMTKKAPDAGKPAWPKQAESGGTLRYHALRGRRRWSRDVGMFDAKTGKVYLIKDPTSYLVIDAVGATVAEGKFKMTDPTGIGGRFNLRRNEAAAIGALKTIGTSQSLFREADKEGDQTLDYGSLKELGDQSLIDKVLASGTKQGYTFQCSYSPTTSEFLWQATAGPLKPGSTGARWFASNHEGVVYYSTKGPIKVDPKTCKIPVGPDVKPVGR